MGLLDKLLTQGSIYTSLDGKTPTPSSLTTPLNPKSLQYSKLDLDGKTPPKYNGVGKLNPLSFIGSKLDLDGKTPPKYLDNKPK